MLKRFSRSRAELQKQLRELQTGKWRLYQVENYVHVDTTGEAIAQIKANIAELDRILAAHA